MQKKYFKNSSSYDPNMNQHLLESYYYTNYSLLFPKFSVPNVKD